MKTLNASQPSYTGFSASRFEAAIALAFSLAQCGNEFIEPELIASFRRHVQAHLSVRK